MLSERKQEERNLRKKSIIKGALSVFNDVGIENTTMDEIALESGFGKATLYYYFSSKDDVFIAIMEQGWQELWQAIELLIIEDIGPRNKFIKIIKKISKVVTENKVLYGFLFTAPNYIKDTSKQTWKSYQGRLYAVLQSIIEDGIKKKEFVNIDPPLLMKAIGGLFHQLVISNDEKLEENQFETMLRKFLNPNK